MPQLNPSPWFYILMSAWISLFTLVFTKILYISHNNPMTLNTYKYKSDPWIWPWH
uniref:ATP synthase complex subunit 8 n=1 Tax=Heloderma suspectum TaxID=8554 RepID=D5KWG1_HELSU|nr:ATPase-8 [Heloderma suspectum]